jgi:HK97 gp10 family phage protein
MIGATVEGDKAVIAAFEQLGPEFARVAKVGLKQAALVVEASAKDDFIRHQGEAYEHTFKSGKRKGESATRYRALGPPVEGILTSRTGALRSSITIRNEGPLSVAIGPTVVYGAIHEFGGTITQGARSYLGGVQQGKMTGGKHARQKIRIVKAFSSGGGVINMPARPYLRPALAKQRERVVEIIREHLANAVAKVIRATGAMRVK